MLVFTSITIIDIEISAKSEVATAHLIVKIILKKFAVS